MKTLLRFRDAIPVVGSVALFCLCLPLALGCNFDDTITGAAGNTVEFVPPELPTVDLNYLGLQLPRTAMVERHTASYQASASPGTMDLGDGIEIFVPADALVEKSEVLVEADLFRHQDVPVAIVFDCTPAQQFAMPLLFRVRQDIAEHMMRPDGSLVLKYLDPAEGRWIDSAPGWQDGMWVSFEVHHFSKYALGAD